jgi:putative transposase
VDGIFHVWFSTKGRAFILEDEVADDVKQLLREIARRARIDLLEVEAAGDHVHVLVRLRDDQTLASALHRLKGASAREILLRYPELREATGRESFWQRGYGWRRLDGEEVTGVGMYIRTQRSRPLRRNVG